MKGDNSFKHKVPSEIYTNVNENNKTQTYYNVQRLQACNNTQYFAEPFTPCLLRYTTANNGISARHKTLSKCAFCASRSKSKSRD